MAKIDAESFAILKNLIDNNGRIQIERKNKEYEITVWQDKIHHHYQGSTLIECLMKIRG